MLLLLQCLQGEVGKRGSGGVSSAEEVPVIDLRNTDDEALVEQIAQACRVYGFFQVTNHGVEGIDHFRDVCKSWFTSDKPKKRRNGTNARGYFDDELTKQVWKGSIQTQTKHTESHANKAFREKGREWGVVYFWK